MRADYSPRTLMYDYHEPLERWMVVAANGCPPYESILHLSRNAAREWMKERCYGTGFCVRKVLLFVKVQGRSTRKEAKP